MKVKAGKTMLTLAGDGGMKGKNESNDFVLFIVKDWIN